MIEFDIDNADFQKSLSLLKSSEPRRYNELMQLLAEATGQTVEWFENKYGINPLDQAHFSEPIIFASFSIAGYFTILGHFETHCGLPTGNITLVTFWKPLYLLSRT